MRRWGQCWRVQHRLHTYQSASVPVVELRQLHPASTGDSGRFVRRPVVIPCPHHGQTTKSLRTESTTGKTDTTDPS